jgi:transcriptional regulator with XRE-family HTH domain
MRLLQFKTARQTKGWTQQEAAARLGVSQAYYSLLEGGVRPVPAELARRAVRKFKLSPANLPLPALELEVGPVDPDAMAAALAALGYPGFAYLPKAVVKSNPAELVVQALAHSNLDVRLVEALPWVLRKFPDLDWEWLAAQCRLLNLQNRLGFLVALTQGLGVTFQPDVLAMLEASRLASEGTLCRDSMGAVERNWVRTYRPAEAAHWNLLTTLTPRDLTHAAA